ncbi:hypothetical protein [Sphingorhabdus sp. Alg239-R122]|uniref:hypothetical protein n=1 Tax=Sphingorhabdus sp. Alg239-R122 TaxID=2305989 RepID=UPI0013DC6250|nr:hypothetical protein [Sphingorhabdus sp. Alg239-R122]
MKIFARFSVLGLLAALAACAKPAPPPVVVAPPPPPPPVVIPAMPTPPLYATTNMAIPPVGVDGRRITVNTGIGELETLWHLRSALNVAALNCVEPRHYQLASDYNTFLKTHKSQLSKANRAIESKFRRENGSNYRRVRDTHSTRVYNFFSLPPVKSEFCNVSIGVARQLTLTPKDQLTGYAYIGLTEIEDVFNRFFAAYDQYKRDLAVWNQAYGPRQPTSSFASGTQGSLYNGTTSVPAGNAGVISGPIIPQGGEVTTTTLPPSGVSTAPSYGYVPSEKPEGYDSNMTVQPVPGAPAPARANTASTIPGYTPSTPAYDPNLTVQPIPGVETAKPATAEENASGESSDGTETPSR